MRELQFDMANKGLKQPKEEKNFFCFNSLGTKWCLPLAKCLAYKMPHENTVCDLVRKGKKVRLWKS